METPNRDGKSLPMFTPKNSDGSQRVIKQIMVIDPNKLRVAGLDLKMAEALKKSKGSKGNTNSNRTKDDKLALAKTLLNRKLKQAKSSKDAQNQNVTKETCDSPQKLQTSVAALQSLLSQPRTYVTPSPKKPHTMLVNILENDQRTGSFELSISNKSHVQQEKQVVELIPKASIKMTKPVKTKDAVPKTIESMVISPEVKFEIKKKSLPSIPKLASTDPPSKLPQVIESKVLSPEEKIDMKTLCCSSTKPVPAKVKIEITKQEILHRMSTDATEKPKECMIVPEITKKDILHRPTSAHVSVKNQKEKPKECAVVPEITKQDIIHRMLPSQVNVMNSKETSKQRVIVPEITNQERMASPQVNTFVKGKRLYVKDLKDTPMECVVVPALKVSTDKRLHSNPKHVTKKSELPLSAVKEESAVDFINSLQMNITSKHETKLKTPQKIEPSIVQEDATSFLMSLFGQQPFTPNSSPELTKTVEAVEPSKPQGKAKSEKDSTIQAQRRNRKPVPIIKHRPRVYGAVKVAKHASVEKVVSFDTLPTNPTPVNIELSESNARVESAGLKAVCDDLPTVGRNLLDEREKVDCSSETFTSTANVPEQFEQGDKIDSGEKIEKESFALEMKSAGLSSTNEVKNSMVESKPKSIKIPKLEEVKSSNSVSKVVDEECVKTTIFAEVERTSVADNLDIRGVEESNEKLVKLHPDDDAVNKGISKTIGPETADAADSASLIQMNVVDTVAHKEECALKNIKSKDANQVLQDVKRSGSDVVKNSANTVDKVVAENLGSTGITPAAKVVGEVISDRMGVFAKGVILATVDCSKIYKNDASAENRIVSSDKPVEYSNQELIQQSPVQVENKKIDPNTEEMKPTEAKEETVPPAPQPTARRKSKKSVPILIAKLSRSRKSASTQEKPNKKETQFMQTADKTSCIRDESVDGKNEILDATVTPQSISKVAVNTVEKIVKTSDPRNKDKQAVSIQSDPQGDIPQEPLQKQCEPVTNIEATTSMETVTQSETPCSGISLRESREETITKVVAVEGDSVTKEISITKENEQEPREEIMIDLPTEPIDHPQQCSNKEKQFVSPSKLREETTYATLESPQKTKADEYQKDDNTATEMTDETTCDLKNEISNTVLWTEAKTRRYSRVRKKSRDQNDHMKSAPAAATTEIATEIAITEAAKSDEAAGTEISPEVAITDAEKSDEAVSGIESPRIESPIPKVALTSKESECDLQEDVQSTSEKVACDPNSIHDFNVICEKYVVKNESISLPTVYLLNEDDDESSNELVIDEDYHCDSDFTEPFQDDTEKGVTSHVDKPSPIEPAVDFESNHLQSADKTLCEKEERPLYASKDDLDFLGFNEKEIEEGQQSTSLRLSQSEDISPMKSFSHSETGSKKKSGPQFKKIPLSVAKKQRAEQKNWKKNSAKSLQNWLKSSEKDASVKEDDTTQPVDTKSADKIGDVKKTAAEDKEDSDCKQDSTNLDSLGVLSETSAVPVRSKKKKGKQEEQVVTEKKTKTEKSSKRSLKIEKEVKDNKESVFITEDISTEGIEKRQSNTPTSACAVESKTGKKSVARGRKKKSKKEEEDAGATASDAKEPKSSSKSRKNITLDEHFLKLDHESADTKSPSESNIREQKRKSKTCAIEVATDATPAQINEQCSNTTKRKLKMDFEEPSKEVAENTTPTPAAPAKKRKYTKKTLKDPATPTASETTKTPKSSRSLKAKDKSKLLDVEKDLSQPVDAEDKTPSLIEPNARKRKALQCDAETPNKVAHIAADTVCEFSTPTPKKRGPKKREIIDTPGTVITPQSERKYKNSTEFNPRLLLIRTKEEFKSDAPLVDPTLQSVPKSKDDVQCALCMGYTPKKRWLQHISEHYGVGWLVGSTPPLNISCRSAVLNYMVEFFKTSKVKGLNCRICNVLRRSALGLLSHIEQCCLTEEELKDTRLTCEHCKKDYSKSSMPSHLRSCPEIWKKKKPDPEPEEQINEKEVVLSNTGRLKRKSVIKAEHKFKDMDNAEISPDEFIKHIPQQRKDYCVAAWQRDITSFGKGFCTEKKCPFTAETVEELEKHCREGVCPHFVQPGYFCMRCKYHSENVESTRKHVLEKHITKASEDFQASEDDAVISQVSSSEDGSSGDEEASENGTGDHDVSVKRKSKKKANSSRVRPQNTIKRNISVKDIRKLVPLPTSDVTLEVARLHQDFINHNYSGTAHFVYAAPNATQILEEDTEPYFPKSPLSPKFALNGFNEPFIKALGSSRIQSDQWQQLQRHNGVGTATEHVMYLGGPVKAVAWVPLMPHTRSKFQYLASVTRKDSNKFSRYLQPKQSRSLVCIHRYHVTGSETKQISGEIYYALAIDDGPIHCIEFLPSGGYDPAMNRLGLLAVGTVKSEVKVYSLPLTVQKRDCDMFPILRIEPSFVLVLELDERDPSDYYTSQCASLSWSQFAGHSHIVGGYVNGFVSIWDIADDDENLNRFLVNGVRKFVPISYFWSKDNRIRGVTTHYDMNGLRWLGVCNTPRKLVFYDLRDITKPIQIMDERAKNDCNAIDWPIVWANPAFALGDAMPTHGACLNIISPTALGYVSKKFERFCTGVTDLHFCPWHNMYAAGSENGDIQITPLRDTVMDVSCRRKKEEKIIASLDIVPLNGDEINECMTQSSHVFETDQIEKYGIVFGPTREITTVKLPELYSPKRVPPLVLSRLSRIHQVRFNPNQKTNTFLAVGYVNGLLRILMDKWKEPVLIFSR